jgi:hypothetical protein
VAGRLGFAFDQPEGSLAVGGPLGAQGHDDVAIAGDEAVGEVLEVSDENDLVSVFGKVDLLSTKPLGDDRGAPTASRPAPSFRQLG